MNRKDMVISKLPSKEIKPVTGKFVRTMVAVSSFIASTGAALANAGYTIQAGNISGSGNNGILNDITKSVQGIGSFMSTTLGELAVLGGFVIAAFLWAFAPKSGAVGYAVRAAVAAIIIFNMTAVISYFTYNS